MFPVNNRFHAILFGTLVLCLIFLLTDRIKIGITIAVVRTVVEEEYAIKIGASQQTNSIKEEGTFCSKWEAWRNAYRHCMAKKSSSLPASKLNEYWYDNWKECLLETNMTNAPETLRMVANANTDDAKMAILPANHTTVNANISCIVVTLGVGGDVTAEIAMAARNPACQFYGADPIKEYGTIYSTIGTYFEIAVGAENGILNASVKNGPGISDYTWKAVPVVDLETFLLKYVNRSTIDHLWIDNEGSEYRLVPLMQRNGFFDRNGIIVCQLNVEMHVPLEKYGVDPAIFGKIIQNFAEKSEFILLNLNEPGYHLRPFFFNAFNPYCVQRYFSDWC